MVWACLAGGQLGRGMTLLWFGGGARLCHGRLFGLKITGIQPISLLCKPLLRAPGKFAAPRLASVVSAGLVCWQRSPLA